LCRSLCFSSLNGVEGIRAEKNSTVTIGFEINTDIVFLGLVVKMLNTSGYTRNRYILV
jgi:hypothetical protein